MESSNDNEPLTFQTLSAATDRVLDQLKQKQDRAGHGQTPEAEAEKTEQNGEYVDQRLREYRAFERRAGGIKDGSRR
jgi:hypothetical protein